MPARRGQQLLEWLAAAAVAAVLLWLSDLLVPPSPVPFPGHGERFAAMTLDPLAFTGDFPHRVLWPLLAHLFGLDGARAPLFTQWCNGLLLAVVFWFCRRRGAGFADSALLTAAIAASGALLVYKSMACFSDSLNLALLVLTVHHAGRPAVFWSLVLLASFSHELVFFFAPWLVWLRRTHGGELGREVMLLAGAVAVHVGWRFLVQTIGPGGLYGASYYFANNFWVPWGMPVLWWLWLVAVLCEFGPLLAVVGWAWRSGCLGGRAGPWLYLAGVLPLMLLAYDVSRFAAFTFLPLLLGGLALLRAAHGRLAFAALLLAAFGWYTFLHPQPEAVAGQRLPSREGGAVYQYLAGQVFGLLQGRVKEGEPMAFDQAMAFTQDYARANWPWGLASLGAVAVVVALGWLLRRYVVLPADGLPEDDSPADGLPEDGGTDPRTMRNASP